MGVVFCPNCGTELLEDSVFCTKCGTKIGTLEPEQTPEQLSKKKSKKKIVVNCILIIIILLLLFLGYNAFQAFKLKAELKRDWLTIEGEDSLYLLILDFSDDEIEYKFDSSYSWLDSTIATYDYIPISKNKMLVKRYSDEWELFTVEFNDEKTMMTVEPALTSIDEKEYWFNFD